MGGLFSQDSYDNYIDDDRIDGIQSALSNIMGAGGDTLQQDHPLIQQIHKKLVFKTHRRLHNMHNKL